MASVNKVILVGNLGKDPATGEKKEQTEWHRVVFFGKLAEIADQYLKKGSQCYIEGSLKTRKWQDQNGQDRYTTEIRADTMKMLGGRPDGERSQSQQREQRTQPAPPKQQGGGGFGDFDDSDIPF